MTKIFLGEPPADIKEWIKDHHGPVVKETTVVKYTAVSGLPDWEGDIVGQLKNVSIPNRSNIAEVEIGSHVTIIDSDAFNSCRELTNVTIPDSVTSIGEYAFFGSSRLTSVTFSGKDKVTVQDMGNYSWKLPSGCVLHCTDGDITI